MDRHEELVEVADAIGALAERLADFTMDALRAQTSGDETAKVTERALASARRSLMKAEHSVRGIARN